jgi:hypothetical protein
MTPHDPDLVPGADQPIDGTDITLLSGMRDLYDTLDPMPADLVDRVQFALALEDLDVEVFRLAGSERMPAAVRGAEETRTITFDSDSLTVMFSVSVAGGSTVRLDGWLAPPAAHRVEIRTSAGPIQAFADTDGRFAVEGVPRGLAQVVVHPSGGRPVVTPSVVL